MKKIEFVMNDYYTATDLRWLHQELIDQFFADVVEDNITTGWIICTKSFSVEVTTKLIEDEES